PPGHGEVLTVARDEADNAVAWHDPGRTVNDAPRPPRERRVAAVCGHRGVGRTEHGRWRQCIGSLSPAAQDSQVRGLGGWDRALWLHPLAVDPLLRSDSPSTEGPSERKPSDRARTAQECGADEKLPPPAGVRQRRPQEQELKQLSRRRDRAFASRCRLRSHHLVYEPVEEVRHGYLPPGRCVVMHEAPDSHAYGPPPQSNEARSRSSGSRVRRSPAHTSRGTARAEAAPRVPPPSSLPQRSPGYGPNRCLRGATGASPGADAPRTRPVLAGNCRSGDSERSATAMPRVIPVVTAVGRQRAQTTPQTSRPANRRLALAPRPASPRMPAQQGNGVGRQPRTTVLPPRVTALGAH